MEPTTTTYGTVHNGITDDDTRIDNLYPTFVLTRANLPEATVDCCWDVVVSPQACFRVLPVHTLSAGLVIRTAVGLSVASVVVDC